MWKIKWSSVVLVGSLTINLLLVGYLVGQHSRPALRDDPARVFPRWIKTLPQERQKTLRPMLRQHLRELRGPVRGLHQEHTAVHQAITAEPFNAEELAARLSDVRQKNDQLEIKAHQTFVDFVKRLTPAERQAFGADLRKPRPSRGLGRGPSG